MSTASADLPPVTYLTTDSLVEGVGASQVLLYAEALSRRGVRMTLHTFEKVAPLPALRHRLDQSGVEWVPHDFGGRGARSGAMRVVRAARFVRGSELLHARSDLAAASALLARALPWIWDVRSFWADQRIALGTLAAGSPEERVLRVVERKAARSCSAIVVLAAAAVPVLFDRHGQAAADKAHFVPTCADLEAFRLSELPPPAPLRFMLAGTLNRYYDVPAMVRLVERASRRGPVLFAVVAPEATPWDGLLASVGAQRQHASPGEMPRLVAENHVGLSVCRADAGVSLRAAVPTKLGEFLGTGRPVVVNPGLGDMDDLLALHRCGVVLRGSSDADIDTALDQIDGLLQDSETPDRCRRLAEQHFDLEKGVDRLLAVYEGVALAAR